MKSLRDVCLYFFRKKLKEADLGCGFLDTLSEKDADDVIFMISNTGELSFYGLTPLFDSVISVFKYPVTHKINLGRVDLFMSSNLLQSLSHLQTLDISDCEVTDYGLSYLATANMMTLRSLDISRCPNITINGLNCLTNSDSLTTLRIDEFRATLSQWPLLQSFQKLSMRSLYAELPYSIQSRIQETSYLTLTQLHVSDTNFDNNRLWFDSIANFIVLEDLSITIPYDAKEAYVKSIGSLSKLKKLSTILSSSDMMNTLLSTLLLHHVPLISLQVEVSNITTTELDLLVQIQSLEILSIKHAKIAVMELDDIKVTNDQYTKMFLFAKFSQLKELHLDFVDIQIARSKDGFIILPSSLEVFKVHQSKLNLLKSSLLISLKSISKLRVLQLQYDTSAKSKNTCLWNIFLELKLLYLEELYITKFQQKRYDFLQALHSILNICPNSLKILSINCCNLIDISERQVGVPWPFRRSLECLYLPQTMIQEYTEELYTFQSISMSPYTHIIPLEYHPDTNIINHESSESHPNSHLRKSLCVRSIEDYYDDWNMYPNNDEQNNEKNTNIHESGINVDNDMKVNPNYAHTVCEKYHTLPPSTDILGEGMSIAQIYECRNHITSQYKPCHMLPRKKLIKREPELHIERRFDYPRYENTYISDDDDYYEGDIFSDYSYDDYRYQYGRYSPDSYTFEPRYDYDY